MDMFFRLSQNEKNKNPKSTKMSTNYVKWTFIVPNFPIKLMYPIRQMNLIAQPEQRPLCLIALEGLLIWKNDFMYQTDNNFDLYLVVF